MGKKKKKRERGNMAATIKKPSVFVVKTTKDNEQDVHKKINEARMTMEFVNKCRETSKKLRKNDSV